MIDIAAFGWPQWVILAWAIFCILSTAKRNDTSVTINAPVSIGIWLAMLIVLAIGGFFGQ